MPRERHVSDTTRPKLTAQTPPHGNGLVSTVTHESPQLRGQFTATVIGLGTRSLFSFSKCRAMCGALSKAAASASAKPVIESSMKPPPAVRTTIASGFAMGAAAMTLDIYADLFDDDLEAVATALDQARSRESLGKMWARIGHGTSSRPGGN